MTDRTLLTVLKAEKSRRHNNGIYHKLQIDFAYNSNHIEGSKLSHDQTRYIFDTKTVGIEPAYVDDIIETVNHFRCFDYIIDTYDETLTPDYIKNIHRILKTGTMSSDLPEAIIGDYKKYNNYVADMKTTSPKNVDKEINKLLKEYSSRSNQTFDDILDFHAQYEKIHPFYDGNGRTGRLIMFKECIRNDIVPFIITDDYKMLYYRGLKEWQTGGEKGYLRDTCGLMQDQMNDILKYFEIQGVIPKSKKRKQLEDETEAMYNNITKHSTNDADKKKTPGE